MAQRVEEYTKPDIFYEELCDEIFKGKYEGGYNRGDYKAIPWLTIRIKHKSETVKEGLNEIVTICEGKIWKGYHNGCLYVKSDDNVQKGTMFKTVNYKRFALEDWKEPSKYSERCGYYFIVQVERKTNDTYIETL